MFDKELNQYNMYSMKGNDGKFDTAKMVHNEKQFAHQDVLVLLKMGKQKDSNIKCFCNTSDLYKFI